MHEQRLYTSVRSGTSMSDSICYHQVRINSVLTIICPEKLERDNVTTSRQMIDVRLLTVWPDLSGIISIPSAKYDYVPS